MKRILLLTMVFFSIFSYAQFPEGFEGATFPPTGWVVEDNGVGTAQSWARTVVPAWVSAGIGAAVVNRDNGATATGLAQDWLITPSTTVPTNGQIRFYARSASAGEQGSTYKVMMSPTGSQVRTDFTITLATYTELQIQNTAFEHFSIPLNAYVGQNVAFAFVMEVTNGLGDRWILDNVKVDQQCLTPTALNVTPFSTTANLSWTSPNPAGPWQIEYGPQGFVQGTGTIVNNILTNSHTLTGLLPLTAYSYYVRTICEADNVSPWSAVRNFTTTVAPPICGGNFVDPGGATGPYPGNFNNTATPVVICPTNPGEIVTVTFSSFNTEPNWDALYVYDGPTTASPLIASGNPAGNGGIPAGGYWGTTIPGPFTSSHPSGCLTFVFRSDGIDNRDGWISNISCSTCPPPARVNLVSATASSLNVSWVNLAPLATSFEVIWLPAGSPPPNGASTGQIVTGSSYVIPSLNSLTTYDVYVRPICSSVSTTGNWSVKGTFTTLPDFCAGDHFYDLGGATANYPNNVTATNGGTTTICAPNPGDFVTVFFNSFDISNDILNIYDGNSNASTLVNIATGNTVIESLQSTGNCLTFEFLADGVNNAAGWDASIVCGPPCPSIISTITNSVPAIATDGKLRICKNQNVQFSGGSTTSTDLTGATYIWKFDDGVTLNGQTVSRTFANEGIYFANLTIILPNGCRNTNKIQQLIYVSPEPIFTTTISDNEICANQTATLSVNQTFPTYTKVCEVPLVQPPLVGDLVGVVRIMPQFINCYEDSAVITSASDIVSVCINMEHSFMGDFRLRLISPAGQVIILKSERGNGATNGRYLGCPIDPGAGPGTFRQYCFTPTATLLIDDPAVPTTVCGNVAAASVVAGSYRPLQSFNGFIGSSVNGLWRLEFMDDWAIDDGYIQQWSIEFNPAFIPANYQFTPVVQSITWDSNPDIISTSGNQITVNPLTPGNKCYTYNVTNDFGCTYSQQVCLDVVPGVEFTDITASPTQICNGGDGVYTFSGTPNAIVTYNINGGANQTITLDGTGYATLTLTGLNLTTDINVTYMTAPPVPTAGNAITTVGGVNPNNSTGAILAAGTTASTANSTTINASNGTVTLTLAHVVPAGTPITVSLAKNNTTGAVNIVDGPSTLLFNTGALNVLQHVTFIKGTTSNTITINRANGTVFLDGVSYSYNELGCDRPLNDSASIVVYATPIVNVTPATCTANGSAIITNYNPTFTYVFNPLGPSIDASGAILNATFGTSYTVALDNVACLTSPSPFVIDAILQNLPTPIINTTPPTCLADGFSTITNYDGTATYTFTPAGPSVDATGLITGMVFGNSYTVIASNTTCNSDPSTPFSNLIMLVTPVVPTVSVTPPTCTANGFATITNYDPAITYVFTPAGPTVDASGVISGMAFNTNYEVAASNGSCTSVNSAIFTIDPILVTPAVPVISMTAPTCLADGFSTITNYDATLTYVFNPTGPTVDATGLISGMTLNTLYEVTASNATCTSVASAQFNNLVMLVTPVVPTVSVTPPTCAANGFATITNYDPAITYVFTPAGPTVDASGVISGMAFNTNYEVAASNGSCTSVNSAIFTIDPILVTPAVPVISMTAPTCLADGFSTITNYDATLTYVFNPAGPTVDATGLISGMTLNTLYEVTASNATCTSVASAQFSNLPILVTPVVPTFSITAPTCIADGFARITNYDAAITYVFTPAGPSVDATGLISGMLFATNYEVAASNGSCTSINSAIFTISQRLPQPTIFNITNNGPICIGSTATFTINATPNSQVDYSVDGNPVQTVAINSSGIGVVNVAGVTASTTINTISIFDGICSSNIALNSTVSLFADTTISLVSPTSTENQTRCAGVTIDPIHYQVIGTATGVTVTGLPIGVTHNYNASTGLLTISGAVNNGGVYNYFITTSGGCNPQAAESGSITITPRPTLTYTVTNTVCDGSTLDFVLSSNLPNTTFSWSATVSNISGSYSTTTNGDETNINQIATLTNPENVGTITMIIIPRANGCDGIPSNPITITVNPNPVIESVTVADSSVCSATNATNNVHVDIVGNISGITYTWTAITNGVNVVGGVTSGTITATSTTAALDLQVITSNPLVAGTIYFEVSSVRNGCPGNTLQSGVVTVNPNPGLPISSPIKTICSGNNSDLIVDVSPLIAGTELTWEVLTVVNVSGANPGTGLAPVTINDLLTATTNTQGYVIYRVRSSLGECQGGYTDYRVNVNPAPLPKLVDGNICITADGEVYQTYTLNTGLNDADYDFEWFDTNGNTIPGATSSTLVVDEAGTYSVIATNWLTGCSSDPLLTSATATVTETLPATSMTVVQSEYFSDNATITVNVTGGSGTLMYSLDEGTLQSSNVFTNVSSGPHTITVVDTQGCTYLTYTLLVIDYPHYFTPNGDGINDGWFIAGLQDTDVIYIFDRYGKLIKQLRGEEFWDGTYNQENLPSTDYWFTVDYLENGAKKQFKAHFSLKR